MGWNVTLTMKKISQIMKNYSVKQPFLVPFRLRVNGGENALQWIIRKVKGTWLKFWFACYFFGDLLFFFPSWQVFVSSHFVNFFHFFFITELFYPPLNFSYGLSIAVKLLLANLLVLVITYCVNVRNMYIEYKWRKYKVNIWFITVFIQLDLYFLLG